MLDADSTPALQRLAQRYAERIEADPAAWTGLCHRSVVGRSRLRRRSALVAGSASELASQLRQIAAADVDAGRPALQSDVAFMFTGQGSQYPRMGQAVYEAAPVFRATLDELSAHVQARCGYSLAQALYGDDAWDAERWQQSGQSQVAIFALEVALTRWLGACGIKPALVFGHSLGEYTAAWAAGVLTLEDAMALVLERAVLVQTHAEQGAMLAVTLAPERARELVLEWPHGISLAAINGPDQVTFAGSCEAIEALHAHCEKHGWRAVRLPVTRAYHSPHMDDVAPALREAAARIRHHAPRIPLLANADGKPVSALDAEHWARHLRSCVQFQACVEAARAHGVNVIIEIGPQAHLSALLGRYPQPLPQVVRTLTHREDAWTAALRTCAQLDGVGVPVDWTAVHARLGAAWTSFPPIPSSFQPTGSTLLPSRWKP